MHSKLKHLKEILGRFESVVIAYSGGADSHFLAKVAHDILGKRVMSLTALSPSFPSYEKESVRHLVAGLGLPHEFIVTNELDREEYRANQGNRCYFCKSELYEVCWKRAKELGFEIVLNGTNTDDLQEIRPGLKAAQEWTVRSPLVEAGLSKKEIRQLSKELGLETWDKPALACLSSRFPPGTEVTEERLMRVDRVEQGLITLGFRGFRVRFHEPIARIEVDPHDFHRYLNPDVREQVIRLCRENGFHYAALDLEGYQVGSVNRVLYQIK